MSKKSSAYYDLLYAYKDYAAEAQKLHALIQARKQSPGEALLDVACGTGSHITHLRQHYAVEGLDLDEGMLAAARRKHPELTFHRADMADFDLGRQFDVIVCLFSAIGYAKTLPRLQQALGNMGRHVLPGGLVIVEPWFTPEQWHPGRVHVLTVDKPDLKVVRMNVSAVEGDVSILDFHYLVGTPRGIEYFIEHNELGLFAHAEYLGAFQAAGLEVGYDPEGLMGRGLYVGLRPLTASPA